MRSAIAALTPTSDPTRIQRLRTRSALRRSERKGRRSSSSTTGAMSAQRTASQIATGMRNTVAVRTTQTATKIAIAPRRGRRRRSASRYAVIGSTVLPASISTSAHAVAAWTRPSPSSAKIVPITAARNAQPPAASPVTVPMRSTACRRSHCVNVMATAIGISRTPSPRKRPGRLTYIRAEAEMIWPHERRRAMRVGATGVQVARTAAKIASPRIAARKMMVGSGLRRSRMSARDPRSTAEQKKSVVLVPNARRPVPRSSGRSSRRTT